MFQSYHRLLFTARHATLLVVLCAPGLTPNARAQAISPVSVSGLPDYLLLTGTIASRTLDWVTTQDCVHSSTCKELELPQGLAANPAGLALFEGGMTALTWFGAYKLRQHHHRELARYSQLISIGETFAIDLHNHRVSKVGR